MVGRNLDFLDQELFRYRTIDKRISERQLELMSKNGVNFITNHTNSLFNNQEEIVTVWDEDITLRNLTLFKETVAEFIGELNQEQAEIFKLRWISGCSWSEIKEKIHCSKASIYRKRAHILSLYADLKM